MTKRQSVEESLISGSWQVESFKVVLNFRLTKQFILKTDSSVVLNLIRNRSVLLLNYK
jgi:hypothetical protein